MRFYFARRTRQALAALAAGLSTASAHASFLSGEAIDTAADWIALLVLFVVPIALIAVFWLIHVLPEKIAHKRHHPQQEAIHTLCLLSLAFGGLLWPLAWLWAYTKPVGYRVAYGTEKHDSYFLDSAEKARAGELLPEQIQHLRQELEAMARTGNLSPELTRLRRELETLSLRPATERSEGGV